MNFADPDERVALAGEYVLGTLARDDQMELERELRTNAELSRAVAYWQDRLVRLAGVPDPVSPSPDLWARIERDLPVPRAVRAPPRPSLWASLAFWRSIAAVAAAASVTLGWLAFIGKPAEPGPRYTAVLQAPDKSAGWLVEADARKEVRLTPLVRTAVGPNQALEFWTKPEGAPGPTSLGLVPADRVTVVAAARLPGLGEGQLFEITLEPATGSPVGRPTGPILFVGRAVAIP